MYKLIKATVNKIDDNEIILYNKEGQKIILDKELLNNKDLTINTNLSIVILDSYEEEREREKLAKAILNEIISSKSKEE